MNEWLPMSEERLHRGNFRKIPLNASESHRQLMCVQKQHSNLFNHRRTRSQLLFTSSDENIAANASKEAWCPSSHSLPDDNNDPLSLVEQPNTTPWLPNYQFPANFITQHQQKEVVARPLPLRPEHDGSFRSTLGSTDDNFISDVPLRLQMHWLAAPSNPLRDVSLSSAQLVCALCDANFAMARAICKEKKLLTNDVNKWLLTLLEAHGKAHDFLACLIQDDINREREGELVFRRNTAATRLVATYCRLLGHDFIRAVLVAPIQDACNSNPLEEVSLRFSFNTPTGTPRDSPLPRQGKFTSPLSNNKLSPPALTSVSSRRDSRTSFSSKLRNSFKGQQRTRTLSSSSLPETVIENSMSKTSPSNHSMPTSPDHMTSNAKEGSRPSTPHADYQGTETRLRSLVDACQSLSDLIMSNIVNVPKSIVILIRKLYRMVEKKFPSHGVVVIRSFLFLRLLCPALISPEQYGILEAKPTPKYQNVLVMLAKLLQSFVNFSGGDVVKLPSVIDSPIVTNFIVKNRPAMAQFVDSILSPKAQINFPQVALEFSSPPPFLWACPSCHLINRFERMTCATCSSRRRVSTWEQNKRQPLSLNLTRFAVYLSQALQNHTVLFSKEKHHLHNEFIRFTKPELLLEASVAQYISDSVCRFNLAPLSIPKPCHMFDDQMLANNAEILSKLLELAPLDNRKTVAAASISLACSRGVGSAFLVSKINSTFVESNKADDDQAERANGCDKVDENGHIFYRRPCCDMLMLWQDEHISFRDIVSRTASHSSSVVSLRKTPTVSHNSNKREGAHSTFTPSSGTKAASTATSTSTTTIVTTTTALASSIHNPFALSSSPATSTTSSLDLSLNPTRFGMSVTSSSTMQRPRPKKLIVKPPPLELHRSGLREEGEDTSSCGCADDFLNKAAVLEECLQAYSRLTFPKPTAHLLQDCLDDCAAMFVNGSDHEDAVDVDQVIAEMVEHHRHQQNQSTSPLPRLDDDLDADEGNEEHYLPVGVRVYDRFSVFLSTLFSSEHAAAVHHFWSPGLVSIFNMVLSNVGFYEQRLGRYFVHGVVMRCVLRCIKHPEYFGVRYSPPTDATPETPTTPRPADFASTAAAPLHAMPLAILHALYNLSGDIVKRSLLSPWLLTCMLASQCGPCVARNEYDCLHWGREHAWKMCLWKSRGVLRKFLLAYFPSIFPASVVRRHSHHRDATSHLERRNRDNSLLQRLRTAPSTPTFVDNPVESMKRLFFDSDEEEEELEKQREEERSRVALAHGVLTSKEKNRVGTVNAHGERKKLFRKRKKSDKMDLFVEEVVMEDGQVCVNGGDQGDGSTEEGHKPGEVEEQLSFYPSDHLKLVVDTITSAFPNVAAPQLRPFFLGECEEMMVLQSLWEDDISVDFPC
eukprot:m.66138 g.66138  ORF g.66138 m.66138 type:complete len:1382 (+) comp8181_c1_seq1:123-4268(+)